MLLLGKAVDQLNDITNEANSSSSLEKLKIILIVSLLLLTIISSILPLWFRRLALQPSSASRRLFVSYIFSVLSCFGGGVFLGTCILDLLPDTREVLDGVLYELFEEQSTFPLAEFFAAIGFSLILCIEQVVLYLRNSHFYYDNVTDNVETLETTDDENRPLLDERKLRRRYSLVSDSGEEVHVDPWSHSALRALLMLLTLSTHALFEGLALGLINDSTQAVQIFTALSIHKSLVGFSLGLRLVSFPTLSNLMIVLSCLAFSATGCMGGLIGLILSETLRSKVAKLITGALQGVACGTFLYIVTFEILPHELSATIQYTPLKLQITNLFLFAFSKAFNCGSISIDRFGFFYVEGLKFRFHTICMEVDRVWLKISPKCGSFCSQLLAFHKNLVLCFGYVRIEGAAAEFPNSRRPASQWARLPVRALLQAFQTVGVEMNSFNVALLDTFPGFLVHLAVEGVVLYPLKTTDTNCSRHGRLKLLTFKVLRRPSTFSAISAPLDWFTLTSGVDFSFVSGVDIALPNHIQFDFCNPLASFSYDCIVLLCGRLRGMTKSAGKTGSDNFSALYRQVLETNLDINVCNMLLQFYSEDFNLLKLEIMKASCKKTKPNENVSYLIQCCDLVLKGILPRSVKLQVRRLEWCSSTARGGSVENFGSSLLTEDVRAIFAYNSLIQWWLVGLKIRKTLRAAFGQTSKWEKKNFSRLPEKFKVNNNFFQKLDCLEFFSALFYIEKLTVFRIEIGFHSFYMDFSFGYDGDLSASRSTPKTHVWGNCSTFGGSLIELNKDGDRYKCRAVFKAVDLEYRQAWIWALWRLVDQLPASFENESHSKGSGQLLTSWFSSWDLSVEYLKIFIPCFDVELCGYIVAERVKFSTNSDNTQQQSFHCSADTLNSGYMEIPSPSTGVELDSMRVKNKHESRLFGFSFLLNRQQKRVAVTVERNVRLNWSPVLHMIFLNVYKSTNALQFNFSSLKIAYLDDVPQFETCSVSIICDNYPIFLFKICNTWKWLRSLHFNNPTGTVLFSDWHIKIQSFSLELCDDPFEVKLNDNYMLMMDECCEARRRHAILKRRLARRNVASPFYPKSDEHELYMGLQRKNASIYIQRSNTLYNGKPSRTGLFTWYVDFVDLVVIADSDLFGSEKLSSEIRTLDADSPWPWNPSFGILFGRYVDFHFDKLFARMRDYPLPYLDVSDCSIRGKLIGCEMKGDENSEQEFNFVVGHKFGDVTLRHFLALLKYFYDLNTVIGELRWTYGPCWDPCLSMISACWELVNRPSLDPSPRLPFWDRIRLLLHGRLRVRCGQVVTSILASADPYNGTERLECTWDQLILEWTNGVVMLKCDFDMSVRTASKYDDCQLLHVPKCKMIMRMDWICCGNPNNHYAVVLCAPNKLPNRTDDQPHDSYRQFRSSHLNISLVIDVQGEECLPEAQFYTNTFRWLARLRNTISAINRPIRRGPLYKNIRAPRAQLSRHYNSPSTPNLRRRKRMKIATDFTDAEAKQVDVHVFSNCKLEEIEERKSFLIGVEKLAYFRELTALKRDNPAMTHKVSVYNVRGIWTEYNRDIVLWIYDNVQKSQTLRRNLSTQATKPLLTGSREMVGLFEVKILICIIFFFFFFLFKQPKFEGSVEVDPTEIVTPPSNMESEMLQQLITESNLKSVAYCEENADSKTDDLVGVGMSSDSDVVFTKWQVELVNVQVALRGCNSSGYLLCTAAHGKLTLRKHRPAWRGSQLLDKSTLIATLSGMQYYATVDGDEQESCHSTAGNWSRSPSSSCGADTALSLSVLDDEPAVCCDVPSRRADQIQWLTKELVQENVNCAKNAFDVVVQRVIDEAHSAGGVIPESAMQGGKLQRIISRCSCEVRISSFSENFDAAELEKFLVKLENSHKESEYDPADCVTVIHPTLTIYTSSSQYYMILDIVNNLILYVDPQKKKSAEKLQKFRFEVQLLGRERLRSNILYRFEERFAVLEKLLEESKELLAAKSDDLHMAISCLKEKQLHRSRRPLGNRERSDLQSAVARRFEVSLQEVQWYLTEANGQLGLAEIQLQKFLYTKVSRINDSGEHEVLQMKSQNENVRKPAVSIMCRELAPGFGGISVLEHFEVTVRPMHVMLTYSFFNAMMNFFFPNRSDDQHGSTSEKDGRSSSKKRKSRFKLKLVQQSLLPRKRWLTQESGSYLDLMKSRAAKNKFFFNIRVNEVPMNVTYKGIKSSYIDNFKNFDLTFPLIEYNNQNWTWLDLAMAIKSRSLRVFVNQVVKRKLLKSQITPLFKRSKSRKGDELDEKDKKRIVLGAKLTRSFSEKNLKKTVTSTIFGEV
ncbi:putative metal cation transporter, ZIP family [Trichinella nativa]|uniref:Putative metal cation transporter, ZIP family n=1 Tax=Trichinella nativa TaxID=6335 RepID=A0A1Y3EU47_9BILA|nr:putative metal cation transporter, ZIP family [Trichinella nativa]